MKKKKGSPRTTSPRSAGPSLLDKLSTPKKDLLSIIGLYIFVLFLFNQVVFDNMIFSEAGDTAAHQSWTSAREHLKRTEQIEPLWFPYILGGLPGFSGLIFPRDVSYLQSLIHLPGRWLFLNAGMSWMVLHYFLAGLFMFLLARRMKFSHLPALIAALTLLFNPYAIGLAGGGHGSKLIALGYIPLMFLLTHYLFERRNILSVGLLAAAVGTTMLSNHVQMVYYGFLLIGSYLVYEVVFDLRENPSVAAKKAALFVLALALGFAISAYVYLPVQEYAQYSIRGGGETGAPGGLDYGYATSWSFHPLELFNYLMPSFFGFSSGYMTEWQGQPQVLPLYWGWMPFTESSVYIGVLPLILTVFAFIYRRNRMTVFLGIVSLLVFFISFGRHLPWFYSLLFNYLPYFNKFRAPAMILHLIPVTLGLLAACGAAFLMDLHKESRTVDLRIFRKRLVAILAVSGVLLVIGLIARDGMYSVLANFMFVKQGDVQQYGQQVVDILKEKRFEILWNDYIKFMLLTCVVLGLVVLYLTRKLHGLVFALALLAVLIVDLYIVDARLINPKPQSTMVQRFTPDATMQFLQADTTLYRVFPAGQLFMDNTYMYHGIQSVGGYSPAKLKIYQDVIDSCFSRGNTNVIDMLNVKYILVQQKGKDGRTLTVPQLNPAYLPRAWFVDSTTVAQDRDQVFQILNSPSFDPRRVAILEQPPLTEPVRSDSTVAKIVKYGAHEIRLETYSSDTALLVLSEVYYPAGWKAYVDGRETDIYKTNYILRSVVVPGGTHTVEFRFDPPMYRSGFIITQVAWGITILLILGGIARLPQVRTMLRKKG